MDTFKQGSSGVIIKFVLIKKMKPAAAFCNIGPHGINSFNKLVSYDLLDFPREGSVDYPGGFRSLSCQFVYFKIFQLHSGSMTDARSDFNKVRSNHQPLITNC